MSTEVVVPSLAEKGQTDRRIDLNLRYLHAGFSDPSLLEDIPRGVTFFLLPDDDPAFAEREIAFAANAARRGDNVYLRHVRVAELPEVIPSPPGPQIGERRTEYDPTGRVISDLVCGRNGEWHETDAPPLGPRDDDTEDDSWARPA